MLKVVLILPPSEHCVRSYLPQVNASEEGIGFKPPLGLLYIATYLRQKFGDAIQIKVIDCIAERLNISRCLKLVYQLNPDVVGISAWTDFWYPAFTLGRKIKQALPSCWLVYGGPHVAIYPEMTLNASHVDAVVLGDGEVPFYKLIKMVLEGNINYKSGEGLHLKSSGVNYENLFYIEKELDSLPIPDRTLVDYKRYSSMLFKGEYSSTMITSRGCPYRCIFCKLYFQKNVCRSAQSVVDEFKYLQKSGIKEVEVYDDTFTWSQKRVRQICEGLIRENIKINWSIRDRVNFYNHEWLKLLKEAGCTRIHYGIESGVQKVLDVMRKKITLEQAKQAVIGAKKLGFEVLVYYMFGNLGETAQDMQETIRFALSLPSDYVEFSITMPYPGTQLYQTALTEGIIDSDYWREFAQAPVPDFVLSQLIENNCNKDELIKIQQIAMRKFYLRPRYICQQLKKISSFSELSKKARMAWGIFFNRGLYEAHTTI